MSPENDKYSKRTNPKYWGVLKYDLNNFLERGKGGIINYPQEIFNFSIPYAYGDHGAMEFLIGSENLIYITSKIEDSRYIYKIKLSDINK